MQPSKSGLWAPETVESSAATDAEWPATLAAPRQQSAAADAAVDDDVKVLGGYQQGGSSGSASGGTSSAIPLAAVVQPAAVEQPSLESFRASAEPVHVAESSV